MKIVAPARFCWIIQGRRARRPGPPSATICEEKLPIKTITRARLLLTLLFFCSGAAALLYQVCWQRLQFLSFGVDIESVTVIVMTFMFGLGLGSLVGGRVADHSRGSLITLFSAAEWAIGLFGLFSSWLITQAGLLFVQSPLWVLVLVNFVLLSIPTMIMGATLPVLVKHTILLLRESGYGGQRGAEVGISTGELYFSNTLGAACGAFVSAFVLFPRLTLDQTIFIAAGINFAVGIVALAGLRRAHGEVRA
jgi:predicted membrane-bound spermidine synthase